MSSMKRIALILEFSHLLGEPKQSRRQTLAVDSQVLRVYRITHVHERVNISEILYTIL